MPDFVFRANIAHFKNRLITATDPEQITLLRKLLAEEEEKLAQWYADRQKPEPGK